ncbi:two component transcriptional regulator, LuxR family [Actinopolyspora xinjiangensis]|uniref:Two component transcriptional regulator, LuxR family n=1 Tax=Actinopolyspora xinjiangensis TaxID=405564 RepID=A0A1H0V905_9ACTN|nr:response regulator transcription factor [Actinopolyspora xinjiangensis]SDP74930.1 two component transcriptional regulator, LuxR family [Actinopolyspora xinjiangensis]
MSVQHAGHNELTRPIRLLLVDDQQLVRSGLATILNTEQFLEVVGEACDGTEAIELTRRLRPDIVLMDIQMPGMDGIQATWRITAEYQASVIILTSFDDEDNVLESLQAGASGFLLKNSDPAQLVQAVFAAFEGHALLAPEVTRQVIRRGCSAAEAWRGASRAGDRRRMLAELTHREREILCYVGQGLSNREIADRLVVGEATIKTHVSSCLHKLQLRDRVKLVVFAFECGLMDEVGNVESNEDSS